MNNITDFLEKNREKLQVIKELQEKITIYEICKFIIFIVINYLTISFINWTNNFKTVEDFLLLIVSSIFVITIYYILMLLLFDFIIWTKIFSDLKMKEGGFKDDLINYMFGNNMKYSSFTNVMKWNISDIINNTGMSKEFDKNNITNSFFYNEHIKDWYIHIEGWDIITTIQRNKLNRDTNKYEKKTYTTNDVSVIKIKTNKINIDNKVELLEKDYLGSVYIIILSIIFFIWSYVFITFIWQNNWKLDNPAIQNLIWTLWTLSVVIIIWVIDSDIKKIYNNINIWKINKYYHILWDNKNKVEILFKSNIWKQLELLISQLKSHYNIYLYKDEIYFVKYNNKNNYILLLKIIIKYYNVLIWKIKNENNYIKYTDTFNIYNDIKYIKDFISNI